MDSKGNAALLKTTRVSEWKLNDGGYIPVAFGLLILAGCGVAYGIAVLRGNIDVVLPLISDAAGSPPQNGLFGTLVCLGGMLGVVSMIQRYMMVLEKNKKNSHLVSAINKFSLFVGILSMLGIPLVTGYPINFYRNREEWLMNVGLPHMIGGLMLFALGLFYIALQCILTMLLKDKNETTFSIRVLFLFLCTASFVYHMITVPEHFGGVSHLYYINGTDNELNYTGLLPYPPTMGSSLKLPIDTSGSYVPSAISQWLFVVFFCCFFFTFFGEAQEFEICIRIETEPPRETEMPEDSNLKARPSIPINPPPAPEVKKLLRRDSTCQTMTDVIDGVLKDSIKYPRKIPAKTSKGATNGFQRMSSTVEADARLTRMLSQCESKKEDDSKIPIVEKTVRNVTNDDKSESEAKNREEERTAIEKIDVVVQNAEKTSKESEEKTSPDTKSGNKENAGTATSPSGCPLSVQ